MSSNYSIIIDKEEHHEDYVRHIFRDLLSDTKPTFNYFIENTKDDWYKGRKLPPGKLIKNTTEKYNNMVGEKNGLRQTPRMLKFLH